MQNKKLDKNDIAPFKLRFPVNHERDVRLFRQKFKDSAENIPEVLIVYGDQVLDFTAREFLEILGFEMPCIDCNDTHVIEVGEGDDVHEVPCHTCGPKEEVDMDDNSGDQDAMDDIQEDSTSMEEKLEDLKDL